VGCGGMAVGGRVTDRDRGESRWSPSHGLFALFGLVACTGWVGGTVACVDGGYVLVGDGADHAPDGDAEDEHDRDPLEASRHGVFAIGDTRNDSLTRFATAVGDGAVLIAAVPRHLAEGVLGDR
jgi:thioredoxin reductase (NADPH)